MKSGWDMQTSKNNTQPKAHRLTNSETETVIIDKGTNTIYIKGLGEVKEVGQLNLEGFIEKAMSLPSFWR